jgi:hypothetical protein
MANTEMQMAVESIARDLVQKVMGVPPVSDDLYQAANDRYVWASKGFRLVNAVANQMVALADTEIALAITNLQQYEQTPGVPKTSYTQFIERKV